MKSADQFYLLILRSGPRIGHEQLSAYCKPCCVDYNQERLSQDTPKIRAEKLKTKSAKILWAKENRERINQRNKRWRETLTTEQKEKYNSTRKAYMARPEIKARYNELRRYWYHLRNKK